MTLPHPLVAPAGPVAPDLALLCREVDRLRTVLESLAICESTRQQLNEHLTEIRTLIACGQATDAGVMAKTRLRAENPCAPLSRREQEILGWIAMGKSNPVIAEILDISPHTVDTHLRRAFQKLGTHDRTTAAIRAINLGLVDRAA